MYYQIDRALCIEINTIYMCLFYSTYLVNTVLLLDINAVYVFLYTIPLFNILELLSIVIPRILSRITLISHPPTFPIRIDTTDTLSFAPSTIPFNCLYIYPIDTVDC